MAESIELAVGDPAPPIHRQTSTDGLFDLAQQRGKWVVVYFFPRSNTPG